MEEMIDAKEGTDSVPDSGIFDDMPFIRQESEPLKTVADLYCAECDLTFKTEGGLKSHNTQKHGATPSTPNTPKPKPKTAAVKLEDGVANLYRTLGMALIILSPEDAEIWCENIDEMSESLVKLAYEYPAVKKALQQLLKGSVVGAVLMAHLPVIYMIASNHIDVLPQIHKHKDDDDTK